MGQGKLSPRALAEANFAQNTSYTATTLYVAGDDTAITDGQRLLFRVFYDDLPHVPAAQVTSFSLLAHNGETGGATGDSYIILPQSVSEYSSNLNPRFQHHAVCSQAVNRASTI